MSIQKFGISALKRADGKPRISSMPYEYDIAEGYITGHSIFSKIGYNPDIDTGTESMWSVGGTYVFPAAAQQMEVISSSAADTSGGAGIRTVTIYYLDNTFAEQKEIVTLNGVTAVPTTATNILRVNNFRASTAGTGGVAAGNIDIRHLSDTPVYSRIATGQTRARNSAYTVPLGKTLYITSIYAAAGGSATGKSLVVTFRSTYDDKADAVGTIMMPFAELLVADSGIHGQVALRFPATTDIVAVATAVANDNIGISSIRGWIESA